MNETAVIHVMIADDHEMVRSGLKTFLAGYAHLVLAAEAETGLEALALCKQHKIDIILMDLKMPEMDGIEAIQAIKKDYPHIQIIALTNYSEQDLLQRALKAGANGYLLKDVAVDDLVKAIEAAYAGEPVMAPQATRMLIEMATQEGSSPYEDKFGLTPRELDVLRLMAQGRTNRQIASDLDLSPATVKTYVSNILAKMAVSSRAEAVATAMQHHMLDS